MAIRGIKILLVLLLSGCLCQDYVEQDRRNYDTLAPRITRMLGSTTEYDEDQKQDIKDRLQSWDTRLTQAEKLYE